MNQQQQHWTAKQRGIALITAMLVVSLATITAVSMQAEQQIFYRRTENILLHDQTYNYLLSAEEFARVVLSEDLQNNNTDSYIDDWATQAPVFPVDVATITGTIEDLHGRFNINNLADQQPSPDDIARFKRLLQMNNISDTLVNAVLDWLDRDQDAHFPDGAEDTEYMSGEKGYRTPDTMMGSISELLLIKGFDYDMYMAIKDQLVALPTTQAMINVNTASPMVLRMVVEGLSEQDAQDLAEELKDNPVPGVEEFISHPLVASHKVVTNGLDVQSEYFVLNSFARVGRITGKLQSVLHRSSADDISVVLRSQGGL